MQEKWEQIEEFFEYAVSDQGRIMHIPKERVKSNRLNKQGFVMTNLYEDQRIHTRSVALLVAKAFLPPPYSDAYNSVIHLDGNRENCLAENLMFRPRWYATHYHRMFDSAPLRVAVRILQTDEVFDSLREACVKYGLVEDFTYADMNNQEPCFHYSYDFRRANE